MGISDCCPFWECIGNWLSLGKVFYWEINTEQEYYVGGKKTKSGEKKVFMRQPVYWKQNL